MGNNAKKKRVAAALAESTPATPAEGETLTEETAETETEQTETERNAHTKELMARWKAGEENLITRKVDHYHLRLCSGLDEMTWEEFCDRKIAAFTHFWTEKKTNPEAGKTTRKLSAEQIAKREAELIAMEKKMAAYRAQIAKSKSA